MERDGNVNASRFCAGCHDAVPFFSGKFNDPDFDIVSYRYVWRVNGGVVRDVTSAARSDQLAAGLAAPGAHVTCDVTPTDGEADGATTRASVQIPGRATWMPPERRP